MGIPILRGPHVQRRRHARRRRRCASSIRRWPRKFFPGEDPVGQQIRNSQTGPPWTIIGLVGDVKHGALDEEPQPEMYVSTYQGADDLAVHRDAHDAATRRR